MGDLLVRGGQVLDVGTGQYAENTDVRIESGAIVEIGTELSAPEVVPRLDARGRTVLPGMIDCHVHVLATSADLTASAGWPSSGRAHV